MRPLIDRRAMFLLVEGGRRDDRVLADCADGGERCDANVLVIRAWLSGLAGVEQARPDEVVAVYWEVYD